MAVSSTSFKKGHKPIVGAGFKKGHKGFVSRKTYKKMGRRMMGKNHHFFGKKHTEETRLKIKEARKRQVGDKCPAWKGGLTPIHKRIRSSLGYKLWRDAVFKRDNWTCIWCGARSAKGVSVVLHADHIKPFSLYPELRLAIDNGRTLCINCHKSTETYGCKIRWPYKNNK